MPRLTKRIVDAIPAAQAGIVWDDALKGFGVKTLAGGGRTYVVNYRNASGRERRMSLGRHGVLTVDEAREKAKQMLARVANGEDPQAERQSARVAPHVTDLLDRYIAEHVKVHNAQQR